MQTVTSRDGTPIAFWRSGRGPSLVLVHGATSDHTTTWPVVAPMLAREFSVIEVDRRGRGESGDSPGYSLRSEAEDIAAVVEAAHPPVAVLGHSYGGLCALESSLLTDKLSRLILYESVPVRGASLYPEGVVQRLQALIDVGDAEGMVVSLLRDLVQMSEDEIQVLRSRGDSWARRIANAPSAPRELRTEVEYVFEAERFAEMRVPTLLLVGGDSPERELDNATVVAAGLPNGRVVVMPGQQHAAMHTAPDEFVTSVVEFLRQ